MPKTHVGTGERITVNLTSKSSDALKELTRREALNRTDLVNRALQLYNMISSEMDEGAQLYMRRPGEKDLERILFF